MSRGHCFYCGVAMVIEAGGRKHPANGLTLDHIFPANSLARDGHPVDAEWRTLNKVEVCRACNNYKGMLHPLDWLVIMPPFGAKRTAERLVKLGCDLAEVMAAMRRRKR